MSLVKQVWIEFKVFLVCMAIGAIVIFFTDGHWGYMVTVALIWFFLIHYPIWSYFDTTYNKPKEQNAEREYEIEVQKEAILRAEKEKNSKQE